ncbi:MAG: M15 family metallopeptidase [Bacteroidaceae bacterium]|nr:M15 family metallopeptidase [Bacteroidaceae bacterium]
MKRALLICILLLSLVPIPGVAQEKADTLFSIQPVPAEVRHRMAGKSYPQDCTVAWDELRYLRVMHRDAQGQSLQGELVCNRMIADDLLVIFRKLYDARYPIERITLIDEYEADDEASMRANNTSCFCYRKVAGSQRLSAHSRGLAVDINPLYNPCVRTRANGTQVIQPATGKPYARRTSVVPYMIQQGDLLCQLMKQHGFQWGGMWRSVKDYQHFEKQ